MQRREYAAGAMRLSEAKTANLSVWVTESDSTCYLYGGSNTQWECILSFTEYQIFKLHKQKYSIYIYIQGVPGGKDNILGVNSIGHSKQKYFIWTCVLFRTVSKIKPF
jgi:hypothetical protein